MQNRFDRYFRLPGAWGTPTSPTVAMSGIRVLTLSTPLRLALPPLFVSSLPRKAIGFSFPRGTEGRVIGVALLALTVAVAFVMSKIIGLSAFPLMMWLTGGTATVMLYNSATNGMAFVKKLCSGCRLLPLIEEHEALHLAGESSEEAVWGLARKKYRYEALGLEGDPRICGFCPIPERLKEH